MVESTNAAKERNCFATYAIGTVAGASEWNDEDLFLANGIIDGIEIYVNTNMARGWRTRQVQQNM